MPRVLTRFIDEPRVSCPSLGARDGAELQYRLHGICVFGLPELQAVTATDAVTTAPVVGI